MADFDWTSLLAPAAGIGASFYGANQNANTAGQALQSQQAGAEQTIGALQPYLQQGQRAASLLGNEDITQLPGYQSGLSAGQSALDRAAAARGQFYSGNALKAASRYATDYNAQKTGERQNQLMQLLGVGQNAANTLGNIRTGLGNTQAASQIAQANSKQSGLTNALDLASKYLTSRDSSGNTGAQNIGTGLSALLGGAKDLYSSWTSPSQTPQFAEDSGPWGSTDFSNESAWWE